MVARWAARRTRGKPQPEPVGGSSPHGAASRSATQHLVDRCRACGARGASPPIYVTVCEVVRAKIVLYAAEGLGNDKIAARLDTPRQVVSKWRKRFFEHRLAGLAYLAAWDAPRQGVRPLREHQWHRTVQS